MINWLNIAFHIALIIGIVMLVVGVYMGYPRKSTVTDTQKRSYMAVVIIGIIFLLVGLGVMGYYLYAGFAGGKVPDKLQILTKTLVKEKSPSMQKSNGEDMVELPM